MKTTLMKNKLLEKFNPFAISQTVYLETRRTTNIDDLTPEEVEKIYKMFFPKEVLASEQLITAKNNDVLKKHRSNILTIATRIGIKEPDSWDKFNNWMLKNSKFKKKLNDHNLEELKELELQFRAASTNYDRSALQIGTKAWYHYHKITPPSDN